ncbi:MAG: DUF1622 domain-containing protein [Candidatus Cyclobacteriaceae bacterium M3_2C_046]
MTESVQHFAEICAAAVEIFGISLIVFFAVYSTLQAAIRKLRKTDGEKVYKDYRHQLARGILLGLELLVAADIIHTVAVDLSYSSVGVLAIVVLIRTFLSFSLEVEISGKWPWQR